MARTSDPSTVRTANTAESSRRFVHRRMAETDGDQENVRQHRVSSSPNAIYALILSHHLHFTVQLIPYSNLLSFLPAFSGLAPSRSYYFLSRSLSIVIFMFNILAMRIPILRAEGRAYSAAEHETRKMDLRTIWDKVRRQSLSVGGLLGGVGSAVSSVGSDLGSASSSLDGGVAISSTVVPNAEATSDVPITSSIAAIEATTTQPIPNTMPTSSDAPLLGASVGLGGGLGLGLGLGGSPPPATTSIAPAPVETTTSVDAPPPPPPPPPPPATVTSKAAPPTTSEPPAPVVVQTTQPQAPPAVTTTSDSIPPLTTTASNIPATSAALILPSSFPTQSTAAAAALAPSTARVSTQPLATSPLSPSGSLLSSISTFTSITVPTIPLSSTTPTQLADSLPTSILDPAASSNGNPNTGDPNNAGDNGRAGSSSNIPGAQPSSEGHGANQTAKALTITGIIVGALFLLVSIIFLVRRSFRRRRTAKAESPPPSPLLDNPDNFLPAGFERNMSQRSGRTGHDFWAPNLSTKPSLNQIGGSDYSQRQELGGLPMLSEKGEDDYGGAVEIDGKEWDGFPGTQVAEMNGRRPLSPVSELSAEGVMAETKRKSGNSEKNGIRGSLGAFRMFTGISGKRSEPDAAAGR